MPACEAIVVVRGLEAVGQFFQKIIGVAFDDGDTHLLANRFHDACPVAHHELEIGVGLRIRRRLHDGITCPARSIDLIRATQQRLVCVSEIRIPPARWKEKTGAVPDDLEKTIGNDQANSELEVLILGRQRAAAGDVARTMEFVQQWPRRARRRLELVERELADRVGGPSA